MIILISVCFAGGLYQGMLMPLLSILLESRGVSAALNGLNASALYIGILAAAPFMERSLYCFGFRAILVSGTLALAFQLALFPVCQSYSVWMVLRFSMGLINHAVFYTILVWLGLIAPEKKRGRYLSYFGFAFGVGFSLGPLVAQLRSVSTDVPFIVTSLICLICALFVLCLKDRPLDSLTNAAARTTLLQRSRKVLVLAWFALLLPFGYGFMESGISTGLPVFLTRHHMPDTAISLILTSFFLSGLITQLPLARLSDTLGRKKTFVLILIAGLVGFSGAAVEEPGLLYLNLIWYVIAGGALGSIYSLGVAYAADSIPLALLPAGNMLCSVAFGTGSLLGPFIGGLYIDTFVGLNFAWLFVGLFSLILCGILAGKPIPGGVSG